MPMTAAQRRATDAERKRRQRQAARNAGRPSPDQVYHAIAEATSFALMSADQRVWLPSAGWMPVNMKVILRAATDILVSRLGADRTASKKAVVDVLRPKPAHRNAGNIPSIVVTDGMSSYPVLAPDAAIPSVKT